MPAISSSLSYTDLAQEFEAAISWLSAYGLAIEHARLARYRAVVRELSARLQAGTLEGLFEPRDGALTERGVLEALYEIGELQAIHRAAPAIAASGLINRLGTAVKGPLSYTAETERSNHPRNAAFELIVAARLSEAGFALGTSTSSRADLWFPLEARPIFVECKRPRAQRSVLPNLREAFSQIRKRCDESRRPRARGIVALDVTRIVNPEFRPIWVDSEAALEEVLDKLTDDLFDDLLPRIGGIKPRRSLAIIVRVSLMAYQRDVSRPVYCQQYGYALTPGLSASERLAAETIGQRMQGNRPSPTGSDGYAER